jgi:hypothetical protein
MSKRPNSIPDSKSKVKLQKRLKKRFPNNSASDNNTILSQLQTLMNAFSDLKNPQLRKIRIPVKGQKNKTTEKYFLTMQEGFEIHDQSILDSMKVGINYVRKQSSRLLKKVIKR